MLFGLVLKQLFPRTTFQNLFDLYFFLEKKLFGGTTQTTFLGRDGGHWSAFQSAISPTSHVLKPLEGVLFVCSGLETFCSLFFFF